MTEQCLGKAHVTRLSDGAETGSKHREIITIQAGQCGNSSMLPIENTQSYWDNAGNCLTSSSRKSVLATIVSRAWHKSRWKPRGLCDRGRGPKGCIFLPGLFILRNSRSSSAKISKSDDTRYIPRAILIDLEPRVRAFYGEPHFVQSMGLLRTIAGPPRHTERTLQEYLQSRKLLRGISGQWRRK